MLNRPGSEGKKLSEQHTAVLSLSPVNIEAIKST